VRARPPTTGIHRRGSPGSGTISGIGPACPRPPQPSVSPLQCVIRCALRVNFQRRVLNSSLTDVDTWAYEQRGLSRRHCGYVRADFAASTLTPSQPPPSRRRRADAASGADRHSAHRASNFIHPVDPGSPDPLRHPPDLRSYRQDSGASPHICGLAHTFRAAIISLIRVFLKCPRP
jgi:hypothetical protein